MESSRALGRCLEQLQISHSNCLRTSRAAASRTLPSTSRSSRRNHLPSSSRALTTTRNLQRDAPDPADVPSASALPPASQADAQPQPRRNSIDLSSITTNPNYKKPSPPSSQVRSKTLEGLDSLLASERTRVGRENEDSRKRLSNNYDIYGGGKGSIFDRTTPSRMPVSRDRFKPHDLVDAFRSPKDVSAMTADLKNPELTLRLKPTLGRSVDVDDGRGFDLTRAFVSLEAKINGRGNSVRKDERNQKFHVRRGQAIKIKRRQRWRVLFKEGFLGECERVRKMIRQGW